MAASEVGVTLSAPGKSRILSNIKCVKCHKVVRNGILCDVCDMWNHFRCANVKVNAIPSENDVWKCPNCIGQLENNMAVSDISKLSTDDLEKASLRTIIITLEEDIRQLKEDNLKLKESAVSCDLEISRRICCDEMPQSSVVNQHARRWETVPFNRGKTRVNHIQINEQFKIETKNQFNILENDFEADGVYGQTLTKDVVKTRPTKPAKKKSRKIKIFTDSYGRGLGSLLTNSLCGTKFVVESMVKPSALLCDVVKSVPYDCANLNTEDFVVILGGANDIACNTTSGAVSALKNTLHTLKNTNVIVVEPPHRHDLPAWSCVNKEIAEASSSYKQVCKGMDNVIMVKTVSCDRTFHTAHGQHFNGRGKRVLAEVLRRAIREKINRSCKKTDSSDLMEPTTNTDNQSDSELLEILQNRPTMEDMDEPHEENNVSMNCQPFLGVKLVHNRSPLHSRSQPMGEVTTPPMSLGQSPNGPHPSVSCNLNSLLTTPLTPT